MINQDFHLFDSALTGINLIAASAGTGKTYTIAHLFTRLVIEKQIPVQQILVVTFTDAATKELRDRIRGRLRETLTALQQNNSADENIAEFNARYTDKEEKEKIIKRLDDALRGFDEVGIFTIHSFCRQMLQEHAFESGVLFDTRLEKNISPLLRECVEDFWRQHLYHASPLLIQYVQQSYKNPFELVNNFLQNERLLNQPHLEITPQYPLRSTQTEENAYASAFHATQKLWATARAEVESLLNQQDSLHGNSYRKTSFPKWFDELNQYFNNKLSLSIPDALEKLCSSYLQSKVNKGKTAPQHLFFESCEFLFNVYNRLNDTFEKQLLALKLALLKQAKQALQLKKQQDNILSFDDLLSNLHKALQSGKGERLGQLMRAKYHAVLIDEFQDTDPTQYEIFYQVYSQCENPILFFIGDPKQAIYSFRGADIFAYLNACETAQRQYTLRVNHRSEADLITAVNQLFSANPNPFIFSQIPFNHAQAPEIVKNQLNFSGETREPLVFWEISKTKSLKESLQKEIAQAVATEIINLLNPNVNTCLGEKPLTGGDIAVLVRTNAQARSMQKVLSRYGIPCVLYSQESLFSSYEVVEIERILQAIAYPQQEAYVRAALATELLGVTAREIDNLIHNEWHWQQRIKSFQEYHTVWETQGFIQMFRKLLLNEEITQRLLRYSDGERRLTNVLHAGEILQQTAVTEKLSISALCNWLATQRNDSETGDEEHQLRLESDEKLVKIVTIHKSKGLEYPIVFYPYSWEMSLPSLSWKNNAILFHDTSKNNLLTLNLASDNIEHCRDKAHEELAESLRLFYVAVTRAKNRCYLVWGAFKDAENSPLGHLLHDSALDGISRKLSEEKTNARPEKLLTETLVHNRLQQLVADSNYTIALQILPSYSENYRKKVEILPALMARQFTAKIPQTWKISSFTALAHKTSVDNSERPDYDENPILNLQSLSDSSHALPSIFSFPKGKRAGVFFHEVFEKMDFYAPDYQKLQNQLKNYAYSPELWAQPLWLWLQSVLNAPLMGQFGALKLAAVSREARLNELEFFYPLAPITSHGLIEIFQQQGSPLPLLDLPLEAPSFSPVQGFMMGFIDMVCCWEGRYYLIDYKSNFLGDRPENYAPAHLAQVMIRERYVWQYHLYAVALHRYLSSRLPDYDYNKHFGGIYYLFLRGIDVNNQENYGVFYDLPQPQLIQALSAYLGG